MQRRDPYRACRHTKPQRYIPALRLFRTFPRSPSPARGPGHAFPGGQQRIQDKANKTHRGRTDQLPTETVSVLQRTAPLLNTLSPIADRRPESLDSFRLLAALLPRPLDNRAEENG